MTYRVFVQVQNPPARFLGSNLSSELKALSLMLDIVDAI